MSGVSAYSPPMTATSCSLRSIPQTTRCAFPPTSIIPRTVCSSDLNLKALRLGGGNGSQRIRVLCNSRTGPDGPSFGENDSKSVLDAFFLGKALAEALNERIESTVGEFLSAIGRLQAEQQKQVQDFQEDVFERAKRAKEKAAREAMETQALIPKSATVITTSVTDGAASPTSPSATNVVTPVNSPSLPDPTATAETDPDPANEGPVVGVSSDD